MSDESNPRRASRQPERHHPGRFRFGHLVFLTLAVLAPSACVVTTESLEGQQGPPGEPGEQGEPGEPGNQPFDYSPTSQQDIYYDHGNLIVGSTALVPQPYDFYPIVEVAGTRGTLSLRTTEPSGVATLRLTGPTAEDVDDWHINAYAGKNSVLTIQPMAKAVPALTVRNNGNVGIGTTDPEYRLHVVGASADPTVVLTNEGIGPALDVGSAGMRTQGPAFLALDGDAKVGIGTAAPQATLDVNGTMRLAKHSSAPFPCDAIHDATIALTSQYSMCVCIGGQAKWAPVANPGGTCSWQ